VTEPEEKTENSTERERTRQKPSRCRYSYETHDEKTERDNQTDRMAGEQAGAVGSKGHNLGHIGIEVVSGVPAESAVPCIHKRGHYLSYTPGRATGQARARRRSNGRSQKI
jgi:hypothetical protein